MDVNGTRFYLYKELDDWRRARLVEQPADETDWYAFSQTDHAPEWLHVDWRADAGLTLRSLLPRFPRGSRDAPLTPEDRRGAGVDQFGNWYWISHDQQRIYWQPSGSGKAAVYWDQTGAADAASNGGSTSDDTQKSGKFGPNQAGEPVAPIPFTLGGLAVTAHHYLVVGNRTVPGLLIFDLHAGGGPTQVLLHHPPAEDAPAFSPFDMAPTADGGVWVLDRENRMFWAFDRNFQIKGHDFAAIPLADEGGFQSADVKAIDDQASPSMSSPPAAGLTGFDLSGVFDPISIEAGPDGTVFILDVGDALPSVVHQFMGESQLASYLLADEIDVVELDGTSESEQLAVVAHDMVYAAHEARLYVVERDGNQAIAFALQLDGSPPDLRVETTYLPMTSHGGRALVGRYYGDMNDGVYYEVIGKDLANDNVVRWVKLQSLDQQRYQPQAIIDTPPLDGRIHDCIWHRVFIDGCIPPDTSVEVWSRAHDDPALLLQVPYAREPSLYLRQQDGEIPFYAPFSAEQLAQTGVGTWELLCQQMRGRYGQIRLVLKGNGRVTPQIRALRIYYPRFSYPSNYRPAAYLEDQESASFLERMLANMEGTFSELEGDLRDVFTLFDGRSAPTESLDWLAGWLGLIVDPIWATIQQKRQEDELTLAGNAPDRRRLFIRFARQLYERRGTPDGIKFALQLLLEPCLEQLLERMQRAAVVADDVLAAELALYGLDYPTPTTGAQEFEELLYNYLLALRRPSTVRIVERFQTRHGRALAVGDPTRDDASERSNDALDGTTNLTTTLIAADAHRFAVLVPEELSPDEEAMIRRIVNLEKPAHTLFEVRRYWDYYRVGEARMGLDTILGESSRFTPIILGRDYLAEGYVATAHPFTVKDRLVI